MRSIVTSLAVALLCALPASPDTGAEITQQLVKLERQAMDGWLKGNPEPALAIADRNITYFHVMTEHLLDGLPAVKTLFEAYRGRPLFDRYEIVEPKVQVSGDIAVLTYLLKWGLGGDTNFFNSTQVYQKKREGWRVIHSHWSQTRPSQP